MTPAKPKRPYRHLTGREVRSIREAHSKYGLSCKDLSDWYGVSYSTAYHVIRRNTWKHIEP